MGARDRFVGELSGETINGHWTLVAGGSTTEHYIWGFISTLGYTIILFLLLTEGKKLAEDQPEPIRDGIKKMNVYPWSLWGVYPVVYIAEALSGDSQESLERVPKKAVGKA